MSEGCGSAPICLCLSFRYFPHVVQEGNRFLRRESRLCCKTYWQEWPTVFSFHRIPHSPLSLVCVIKTMCVYLCVCLMWGLGGTQGPRGNTGGTVNQGLGGEKNVAEQVTKVQHTSLCGFSFQESFSFCSPAEAYKQPSTSQVFLELLVQKGTNATISAGGSKQMGVRQEGAPPRASRADGTQDVYERKTQTRAGCKGGGQREINAHREGKRQKWKGCRGERTHLETIEWVQSDMHMLSAMEEQPVLELLGIWPSRLKSCLWNRRRKKHLKPSWGRLSTHRG